MELIGTASNCSHCIPFKQDWFLKVPRSLLNRIVFQNKDVALSFVVRNKDENSFNSIF